jgi:uncharacterized protein YdhG (YjbR/CyaY superfamily)
MSMAKTSVKTVEQYIAGHPAAVRRILTRVRNILRKALSDAEETISYGIPTYKLRGRPVIYFAGWSKHYSLYPSGDRLVAAFREDLARYEVNKGTIRFPLDEAVPVKLIESIAKFRAKEVAELEKGKTRGR